MELPIKKIAKIKRIQEKNDQKQNFIVKCLCYYEEIKGFLCKIDSFIFLRTLDISIQIFFASRRNSQVTFLLNKSIFTDHK